LNKNHEVFQYNFILQLAITNKWDKERFYYLILFWK